MTAYLHPIEGPYLAICFPAEEIILDQGSHATTQFLLRNSGSEKLEYSVAVPAAYRDWVRLAKGEPTGVTMSLAPGEERVLVCDIASGCLSGEAPIHGSILLTSNCSARNGLLHLPVVVHVRSNALTNRNSTQEVSELEARPAINRPAAPHTESITLGRTQSPRIAPSNRSNPGAQAAVSSPWRATAAKRLLACCLDHGYLCLIVAIAGTLIAKGLTEYGWFLYKNYFALMLLLHPTYFLYFLARYGCTPGQRCVGLKVFHYPERPQDYRPIHGLSSAIGFYVASWIGIGLFWRSEWSQEFVAWHDRFTKTVVHQCE